MSMQGWYLIKYVFRVYPERSRIFMAYAARYHMRCTTDAALQIQDFSIAENVLQINCSSDLDNNFEHHINSHANSYNFWRSNSNQSANQKLFRVAISCARVPDTRPISLQSCFVLASNLRLGTALL
jgi:hypothetical protein